jgi:hypothetical protein
MFNQSQPVGFLVIAATVVAIVAIICIGIIFVKQKQHKESE